MRWSLVSGFGWICLVLVFVYVLASQTKLPDFGKDVAAALLATKKTEPPNVSVTLDELMRGPLAQNDSRIIDYIWKKNFLQPPSKLPYRLSQPHHDPSMGQSVIVKHALKMMDGEVRNGFFVEAGALDGETRSNTLMFERDYGWKGLLIEADPKNYERLILKNRKAWTSSSCLATKRFPHQVIFQQQFNMGKISSKLTVQEGVELPWGFVKVQCFPLFSLLAALNVTQVDYLSLDIEGSELEVLKTIPFDSIFIKVLSVEYVHDKGGREAVKKFMVSKGFRIFGEVRDPHNLANDLIFQNSKCTDQQTNCYSSSSSS